MIEVKNVTKKYGKFTAVNDLNFTVNDNEIVGFLGPNGAGKSTTMNMITGYIEPSSGVIIINGYDMSKTPKKAKREIGYMPESVPLYSELTVREFVNYMADLKCVKRKVKKQAVDKVLEETGISNVQHKLIKNISRGYKQRVSLAGALIGNPKILILDEPTVGLDPKQITEIRQLIKDLGKNHTIILSSHILSEVSQICEKVIIINKGNILAIDTPENLEKNTKAENSILLTVEDPNEKMKDIDKKLPKVKEIKLVKDNKDGTKQYLIVAPKDIDIRKKLFDILPKEDITIFELKQSETTLEDAFLKVINEKEAEAKKAKEKEEKELKKKQEKLSAMTKSERKVAIKEEKKEIKQAKKEELDKEFEKEKEEKLLIKKAKEERKSKKKIDTKKEDKSISNAKKENSKTTKAEEPTTVNNSAKVSEEKAVKKNTESTKKSGAKETTAKKKTEVKNATPKKETASSKTKTKAKASQAKAPNKKSESKKETKKGGNK